MSITMVKKINSAGIACPQCQIAERALQSSGHWGQIDHIAIADEGDPQSEGLLLAAHHHVTCAPFFIITGEAGVETIFLSYQQLLSNHFAAVRSQPITECI